MKNIHNIIRNMSSDVRAKAEAFADSRGISLEQAVSQQLGAELTDADLQSVVGGGEVNHERDDGVEENTEFGTPPVQQN